MQDFKEAEYDEIHAREIFRRFICLSGELEVNVSSKTRSALISAFSGDSEHIHHEIFDSACKEIMRLMTHDSFSRLRTLPHYVKYWKKRKLEVVAENTVLAVI